MLLDRIEIDSHGPLNRVELGPLSHHLNVVLGAPGSGKTAIGRFIRDSLIDREYPRGMLSGSAGRVVWVHQNGWIHCRREKDGSSSGRRSVEFESRSETAGTWDGYADGWFDGEPPTQQHHGRETAAATARQLRSSLASRTLHSIRIPESIVDGVMVDTTVSSASRVVAACIAAGLDQPNLAPLTFENETAHYSELGFEQHTASNTPTVRDDRRRRDLRAELADVEAELAKRSGTRGGFQEEAHCRSAAHSDMTGQASEIERIRSQRAECIRRRDELLARRADLVTRLDQELHDRPRYSFSTSHQVSEFGPIDTSADSMYAQPHWIARDARLRALHQRADALRSRASALQRGIAELDVQNRSGREFPYDATFASESGLGSFNLPPAWHCVTAEQLQNRIRHADQEIVSLRRVLADVLSLRDLLDVAGAPTTTTPGTCDWLVNGSLQGRRYDHFVRAMDHYGSDLPWSDFYASAYYPSRAIDDLAMRIESTTRHLDCLLARFEKPNRTSFDHSDDAQSWMRENERDGMIEQSLRSVRDQLGRRTDLRAIHIDPIIADLNRTLDQLLERRHRVVAKLAGQQTASRVDFKSSASHQPDWLAERHAAVQELASVEQELQIVLDQTAVRRHGQRSLPIVDPAYPIGMGYATSSDFPMDPIQARRADAWQAEVRSIDAEISQSHRRVNEYDEQLRGLHADRAPVRVQPICRSTSEIARLQQRRVELIAELGRCRPTSRVESSLAELASRWLIRLSNGRQRMLRWSTSPLATDRYTTLAAEADTTASADRRAGRSVQVTIDHVDERHLSAATRAVAALAVRLAAGELLGRMGHAIPLVFEVHRELFSDNSPVNHRDALEDDRYRNPESANAYQHFTCEGVSGDAIASALADYAAAGRQLLILTENTKLANDLQRCGARHFALHTQPIIHPHRPMWRGGQRHDHYAGPHAINADGLPSGSGDSESDLDGSDHESVNREFDHAWRQSTGLREESYAGTHATDTPAAGAAYRDGYFYAQQSTTVPSTFVSAHSPSADGADVSQSLRDRQSVGVVANVDDVPFFLTVDSPIDGAPSIDAVAAQRLRRIGISHITHLMNQDSNRLADTLGLAGVDARTIRRWQSECRLMCRVPQLRGFDARVLVGCGITDPAQLAAIHPTDLLDRVKTFLATERGQRILLSGTSYELSRITSWIASANDSTQANVRSRTVDGRRVSKRAAREGTETAHRKADADLPIAARTRYVENDDVDFSDDDFDQERYEVQVEQRADQIVDDLDELTRQYDLGHAEISRDRRAMPDDHPSGESEAAPQRPTAYRMASEASAQTRRAERNSRRQTQRTQSTRRPSSKTAQVSGEQRSQALLKARAEPSTDTAPRFNLQSTDNVVDAPSIGPRMAERLNTIGINTVHDLLHADAAKLAENLRHRRVETSTVIAWQQQTTLVCRVPTMRGHDAQFLVAAGITTAEELAKCAPKKLFALVSEIAKSTEGKRIARGGALPDLAEVTHWIESAAQHRSLRAA